MPISSRDGIVREPTVGISSLSELNIDADKDWLGHVVKNLGAPSAAGDAVRLPVLRANLEYPTAGVSFAYLSAINKLAYGAYYVYYGAVLTADDFADKSVRTVCGPHDVSIVVGRLVNKNNLYESVFSSGETTRDHYLRKYVAGTITTLATEAVDFDSTGQIQAISCLGSTIKSLRYMLTSPVAQTTIPTWTATLTATDTSIASGKFGPRPLRDEGATALGYCDVTSAMLDNPLSPTPEPIAYFEAPVVGSGTYRDPFRVQMPEEIAWEWGLNPTAKKKYDLLKLKGFTDEEVATLSPDVLSCRVNRLALTHSCLIKADKATGKPVEYTAMVRVFEQPDRQAHLRPILDALTALRGTVGVRELTRDEAVKRAKQIDPDLTDVDLVRISPTDPNFKIILRDYIRHREGLGVKRELIDEKLMERYLSEGKGW